MKSKLIIIALLVSLAFNIGFIITFAYCSMRKPQKFMPPPPPKQKNERMQKITKNEAIFQLKKENIELRKSFFAELATPEPDMEKIAELQIELEKSQTDLEKQVLQHFITIRGDLDNEEAAKFFNRFQNMYSEKNKKGLHQKKFPLNTDSKQQ